MVLAVDVLAFSAIAGWCMAEPPTAGDVRVCLLLVAAGLLVGEVTSRAERMRRRLSDTPHVNMSSVTILAVTLLTSPVLGGAAAVALYLHLWWRATRWVSGMTPYRAVFNTSVMVISATASDLVARSLAPLTVGATQLIVLVAVIGTYWAVNSALVGAVIAIADGERSLPRLLGGWNDNALLLVTLCVGALAVVLIQKQPWMAVLVMPVIYVLHRSASVKHLEVVSSRDAKTGLLRMDAWRCLAEAGLAKAHRHEEPVAVLMIDIDHFKAINDGHDHMVGDDVLRAVAEAMCGEVRRTDLVGRFGGEEFVVFLADVEQGRAIAIAERIRQVVSTTAVPVRPAEHSAETVSVSVSIGVACDDAESANEGDLNMLMLVADNRLFVAKDRGRDQVRAG
ncbi:GGDEF domain-containing protein [Amycolatopsis ultiminotia]|uniref:GGDEF domain-containing protein n=2 Tax=Amycolatopsis ultiminotia TaxID=543629 RepID=A0ABP6YNN9_9PSEU